MLPVRVAADPANPQSWNRYAYVMNNPTNGTDPSGLIGPTIIGVDPAGIFPPCFPGAICVTSTAPAELDPILQLALDGLELVPNNLLNFSISWASPPRPGDTANRQGWPANNGMPQQPSKVQERLERLKNCALGYYGIDPLSVTGLSSDAKWGLIAAAAGGIPKAVPDALGMRVIMLHGSSRFTSVLSMISVAGGGGTLRTIANFGSKWAGPIAIASAVIDTTAIGICTASD